MDATLKATATHLIEAFSQALAKQPSTSRGFAGATEAVSSVLHELSRDNASYKDADYALARFHGHISRLVGYKDLELDAEAKRCWNDIKTFVQTDAHDDLRGVGGPALM